MAESPEETSPKSPPAFTPDSSIKKFLTELSTPKLIGIINECCKTNYPLDSQVEFLTTEHFTILGTLDKNSVRGDLVAGIQEENHQETTHKILIELQSSKDDTMGFRMFVYSLNVTEQSARAQYVFPKAVTLYTTLDMPEEGMDEVTMQIEHFSVGEQKFSAKQGDLLKVSFPYVNILAKDFQEFQNSPLEPLKIIYPYRYRKDPMLMKKESNYLEVMETVRAYTTSQEGNDRQVVSGLVSEIVVDLYEICMNNPDLFEKEMEIMSELNKTSTELYGDQCHEKGKLEGIFEVARNLLDTLPSQVIALKTGLTLAQVEQLRAQQS